MIKCLMEGLQIAKDVKYLLSEVDKKCKNTVSIVKANGVVLEEFKDNDFVSLRKNN